MNILFPGSGLFYSRDKHWMSSTHLVSYLAILGLTNNSYNNFLNYRDDYQDALIEYYKNPNILNRNIVEQNYNFTKNSKKEFRNYIGVAIVVNILSNYYLDRLFKGKVK